MCSVESRELETCARLSWTLLVKFDVLTSGDQPPSSCTHESISRAISHINKQLHLGYVNPNLTLYILATCPLL